MSTSISVVEKAKGRKKVKSTIQREGARWKE